MCPNEKLGARLGVNQRLAYIHVMRAIVLQPIVLVVDVLMDGFQMPVPAAPCQRRICLYANAVVRESEHTQVDIIAFRSECTECRATTKAIVAIAVT